LLAASVGVFAAIAVDAIAKPAASTKPLSRKMFDA
jgi:hypothetical protein